MAPTEVLDKIRLALTQRNARIEDNFTDFDNLNSGTITKEQFRRCLTITDLSKHLTEIEISNMMSKYQARQGQLFINYRDFLNDIYSDDAPDQYLATHRGIVKVLPNDDEKVLLRMYIYFYQRIKSCGLDIRLLFKDFDKHHIGIISKSQFERCFPFEVDPAMMKIIMNKYSDDRGDVAYLLWCKDVVERGGMACTGMVDEALAYPTIAFSTTGSPSRWGKITNNIDINHGLSKDINNNNNNNNYNNKSTVGGMSNGNGDNNTKVNALIKEIASQIYKHRLRCDDYLRDYDRARVGLIPKSQFAAALGRMKLVRYKLSDDDINILAEYYATADNNGEIKVSYVKFLSDVQPINSITCVSTTGFGSSAGGNNNNNNNNFNNTNIINDVNDINNNDINNNVTCDAGGFVGCGKVVTSSPVRTRLAYGTTTNNNNTINNNTTNISHEEEILTGKLLLKIKETIASQRMNLRPHFRDFDHATNSLYRTHTCTATRFERTLNMNNVFLTSADLKLLIKRYGRVQADGSVDVNYKVFCDDVDAIIPDTNPNLIATSTYYAQRPQVPHGSTNLVQGMTINNNNNNNNNNNIGSCVGGVGTTSQGLLRSYKPGALAAGPGDNVHTILTRLMDNIIDRRVRLSEFLNDADPLHSGLVPNDRFCSAIITSNIIITEEEMDVLCSEYASTRVPRHVDIRRFLSDIDTGVIINKTQPDVTPIDKEKVVKQELMDCEQTVKREGYQSPQTRVLYNTNTNTNTASLITDSDARVAKVTTILIRVRDDVKARGILLPPFFSDYDKHHCGKITKVQFHQTISRHRFPVSEGEVSLLQSFYEDPYDSLFVRYRDFIADIDDSENPTLQLQERSSIRKLPLVTYEGRGSSVPPAGKTDTARHGCNHGDMTWSAGGACNTSLNNNNNNNIGETSVQRALQKVADFVLRRNLRLQEFFKDSDPLKHGLITSHRFRHALDILGHTHGLTEEDMISLETAFTYRNNNNITNNNNNNTTTISIDYPRFLAAVKATPPKPMIPSMTSDKVQQERSIIIEAKLHSVLEKVRRSFGSRRVLSRHVMRDYDKLHKGRVTVGLFFTALLSVGLTLTPAESDILTEAYSTGDGYMIYGEFCNSVDEGLVL